MSSKLCMLSTMLLVCLLASLVLAQSRDRSPLSVEQAERSRLRCRKFSDSHQSDAARVGPKGTHRGPGEGHGRRGKKPGRTIVASREHEGRRGGPTDEGGSPLEGPEWVSVPVFSGVRS